MCFLILNIVCSILKVVSNQQSSAYIEESLRKQYSVCLEILDIVKTREKYEKNEDIRIRTISEFIKSEAEKLKNIN